MGWGVTVDGVFLNKLHTAELKDRYEENEKCIKAAHTLLIVLAAATPRDKVFREDVTMPWEDYIRDMVEAAMENIQDAAGQNFVIGQILCEHSEVSAKNT